MRPSVWAVFTVALLAGFGCERPVPGAREREVAMRAIPNTLSFPRSTITQLSAGTDAAEITLVAPATADEVAAWYRQFLQLNEWQLMSDTKGRDGTMVLHATKDGRPLWITVHPNTGGPETTYTLVGAVVEADSVP